MTTKRTPSQSTRLSDKEKADLEFYNTAAGLRVIMMSDHDAEYCQRLLDKAQRSDFTTDDWT